MGLEEKHIQAISIMLSDHFIGDAFDFKFLEAILKQMGIIKEDISLDNKSIRIINRLREYHNNHVQDGGLRKLFEKEIITQTIRVKGRPD